jgi:hypothetical protein
MNYGYSPVGVNGLMCSWLPTEKILTPKDAGMIHLRAQVEG